MKKRNLLTKYYFRNIAIISILFLLIVNVRIVMSATIIDETFEGIGYEETWIENIEGASIIDEDALSSLASSPTDWGTYCLEINPQTENNAYISKEDIGILPVSYTRFDFYIDSETLTNNDSASLCFVWTDGYDIPFNILLEKDGAGNIYLKIRAYHNSNLTFLEYQSLNIINTSTVYTVEIKWDATADKWAWRIDGVDQENNIDNTDPITTEGTLTGAHPTDLDNIEFGYSNIATSTYHIFFDRIAVSNSDWLEAGGYTKEFKPGTNLYTIGKLTDVNVTVSSVTGSDPWTVSFSGSPDLSDIDTNDCFTDGLNSYKWKITGVDDGSDQVIVTNSEYTSGDSPEPSDLNSIQATVGRWYSSIQSWETDREGDLVVETRLEKGVCYNDGIFDEEVLIDGSTTSADYYMMLTVDEGQRHDGKRYSDVGIRLYGNTNSLDILDIDDNYFIVEWLQIYSTGELNEPIAANGGSDIKIRNCIIWIPSTTIATSGIVSALGNDSIYNNLIYGDDFTYGIIGYASAFYANNVIYGSNTYGIYAQAVAASQYAYNNIVFTSAGSALSATFGGEDYNIVDDASSTGGNSLASQTLGDVDFVSTTLGSEDFHIQYTSVAKDAGTDLSFYFVNDIDNNLRTVPWDIGAYEYNGIDTFSPINDILLNVSKINKDTVLFTWSITDTLDKDSIGIWYKTINYPSSNIDSTATFISYYSINKSVDTISGFTEKTKYYFSAMVKDTSGNWSDTTLLACDSIYIEDYTAPENNLTLNVISFSTDTLIVSWNPSAIVSLDADSVGLWLSDIAFAKSATDTLATFYKSYSLSDSIDTLFGFAEKTKFWFSAMVRDTTGNWNLKTTSSCDTITVGDYTAPINNLNLNVSHLGKDTLIFTWNPSSIVSLDASNVGLYLGDSIYTANATDPQSSLYKLYTLLDSVDTLVGFIDDSTYWFSAMAKDTFGNWSDTIFSANASIYILDYTAPINNLTLDVTLLNDDTIIISWNPSAINSLDADSVGLWVRDIVYPSGVNDTLATFVKSFKLSDSSVSIFGYSEKTSYWFSLMIRDTLGNWSDTTLSACDSVYIIDYTAPINNLTLDVTLLNNDTVIIRWDPLSIVSLDASNVGLWLGNSNYAASSEDTLANLYQSYILSDSVDTLYGLTEKNIYWFSAMVRDSTGNWSDTTITACDTVTIPDQTAPINNLYMLLSPINDTAISLKWKSDSILDLDVDSIAVWYSTIGFPPVLGDSNSAMLGIYSLADSLDTLFNLSETTLVYFTISLRDSSSNWALASPTNMDTCRTGLANRMTIYPGDCNNDSVVNVADILPIGLYFGITDKTRSALFDCDTSSLNISGQKVLLWEADSLAAYADANGDGIVDVNDVMVIACNWHKRWEQPLGKSLGIYNTAIIDPLAKELNLEQYREYENAYLEIYEAIKSNKNQEGFKEIIKLLENMLFISMPTEYSLRQNYPNPFNPTTTIEFAIPMMNGAGRVLKSEINSQSKQRITLAVYDIKGRLVRNLMTRNLRPGFHKTVWNGKANNGRYVSSGLYLYRFVTNKYVKTRKMVITK